MNVEHIAGRATTFDKVEVMEEHIHKASQVFPTLAAGVGVLSGAIWTLGNFVEIIPADTIATDFDMHWLIIENVTDDEVYEVVLYNVETEIARIRFAVEPGVGNSVSYSPVPIQTLVQRKNSQIQAKLASSGAAETVTMSLMYHVY